jgi:transposase InsO family protein
MNIHKNARLTPQGRLLLVERIMQDGWNVARAAQAAGLSARQTYRWCARYRAGGAAALADRNSAPQHCPHRTPELRVAEIKRLREEKRLTGPAIARQLGMPVSTVGKVLRRLGLGRLSALEAKPPARRYQRERPGELIHIDVKKLGRIEGIGHRITGDRRHRPGAGWEYVHVCIDDASRLAYSEMLPDERKESAVPFLERALDWFAGLGVTIERVMTDNGSAYRSHLWRRACATRGLRHIRTRPYTPRTNGKAERFIQTGLREWAYAQAYTSSQRRQQALADWLGYYNTVRPHTALANQPPAARLRQNPFLGSTAWAVPSSRPGSPADRSDGPGQGSPKATGASRRAASLRRTVAAVTLVPGGSNA